MSETLRHALLAIIVFLSVFATPPASGQEEAPPDAWRRKVFALYMVCFFSSIDFYKQEMELAQRHGIDGFLLDFGAWARAGKDGKLKPTNYVEATERMFEAARQLNTGFLLIATPEYSVRPTRECFRDFFERFYDHPNMFRIDAKPVAAVYGGNLSGNNAIFAEMAKEGRPVCHLGYYSDGRHKMAWSFETAQRFFQTAPGLGGLWHFTCDGQTGDLMRVNANARRATLKLDKVYMAGVSFGYNSANLRDHQGMRGFGALWRNAIDTGADLVGLITWNDYVEDSNLMPWRWQRGWGKQHFTRDESYLDVNEFYSAWFKAGAPPTITQDKLFFTYRSRSRHLTKAWDPKNEKWVDILAAKWPFDQIHDDVNDSIYVTTFLRAPAGLTVAIGQTRQTSAQPAGISHAAIPFEPGVPRFTLHRAGKLLLDVVGRKQIIAKETKANSLHGKHLAHRIWTGGAAIGPATRLEAEAGTLHANASLATAGQRQVVATKAADGSGFTVPVAGLKTAAYNIRVTYSNPAEADARLTLIADGPTRGEKEYPYFIPVHFPPTKEGEFVTTSFLWSLYENTSFLKLVWLPSVNPDRVGADHWSNDDYGSVLVDAVDLVRVEPVQMPATRPTTPELVHLPGSTFTMGSDKAEPDEAPRHKVSISPFAIGKYEVGNREFERFDPTHRRHRDGYSWRDRDPVIYVSWTDAARYCNWLSAQTGLTPAYDEKSWALDRAANGFRLPTEAEWEYVARGRGEGRKYPWG